MTRTIFLRISMSMVSDCVSDNKCVNKDARKLAPVTLALYVKIMITKSEIIRRHTNSDIKLLFNGGDPLAVIALSSAAFQIARDLAEHSKIDGLHKVLKDLASPGKEKELWKEFNKLGNFLKHADKDPYEQCSGIVNLAT